MSQLNSPVKNIWIRIIGAPLLLGLLGLIFYWDCHKGTIFGVSAVMTLATALGLYEFYGLCRTQGYKPLRILGILFAIISMVLPVLPNSVIDPLSKFVIQLWLITTFALAMLLKYVFFSRQFSVVDVALTVLGYFYLTLWGHLFLMIRFYSQSIETVQYWLLALLAMNKGSDIAAYCFGKLFGKAKLAPSISPNKTWLGTIAGFFAGAALGVWLMGYADSTLGIPLTTKRFSLLMFLCALVTIGGQVGDLVESALKRWAGVKDSGKLLPEFGGCLDLIDCFLVSTPLFVYGYAVIERLGS